ncbi:NAD(P)-binding domain-containing protein [Geothrix sp. 21YS21S-4]|uniref:NAD(P)-binding domain-containing protein n=1 Tax=Geothrix sp. 21YS21S-4 TaxID=3068889 RepID=UPI0027BA6CA0|nr:NAD(P)-binding domain-containing protein [Geothrix sp. 21YS21S-4]
MSERPVDKDLLDLLIVGAGPAGIATAVEAREAGIERILLLEKGPGHSFSIEKLYTPGKRVDKVYLGQEVECEGAVCIVDGTRETVLATLDDFVRQYGLEIRNNTEVTRITPLEEGGFEVQEGRGTSLWTRTVVIAIGVYGRPNRPDYPIPSTLKAFVRFDLTEDIPAGEGVLVVGGGNTALEYVAFLYADHPVTLAYRGAEFAKANEVNRRILQNLEEGGQATVWRNADIASLRDAGEAPRIEATFKDGRVARFHHAVLALGGATPEGFLREAGVELDGKKPRVDHRFQSGVPGLYLAGDLVAGGKGSIVKAFNTGRTVVWEGLCQDHLECRIPGAGEAH